MLWQKSVYEIGGYQFVAASGEVNRTHRELSGDSQDIVNIDFPTGCDVNAPDDICAFNSSIEVNTLGAIASINTFRHETFMLIRSNRLVITSDNY
jgi:hypothetical protein